jgi:basic membrane lipoprotein Med (substrate-binding protein (PBP1-ABC) superfamily)
MANRLIVNVLGCLIAISLISGCGSAPRRIEVSAKPVEKPALVLPKADELNMKKVEWVVLTQENFQEQFAKIKANGGSDVFFAIIDKGYENLGLNISSIRSYIQQQQAIIAAYEAYYKASEKTIDTANGQIESAKSQVEEQQKVVSKKSFWEEITN